MLTERSLPVENRQGDPGLAEHKLTRRGKAHYAATHDHDIEFVHAPCLSHPSAGDHNDGARAQPP